jgi:hypothetical protein
MDHTSVWSGRRGQWGSGGSIYYPKVFNVRDARPIDETNVKTDLSSDE